ncbi:MAG: murein hydrolase activator EnvC family protein [Acidiferrobacterales bacterium]
MVLCFACCSSIYAESTDEQAAQLERVRAQIKTLQRELNEAVQERDSEREQLRAIESRIGRLLNELRQLDGRLKAQQNKLSRLEVQRKEAFADLRVQKSGLERQLRAAYVMGRQEYIKMLLNQDDPATFSRVLTYYRYLNSARINQIGRIEAALSRIRQLEDAIQERTRELEALQAAQLERKRELEASRARRTQVLARLGRQVQDHTRAIARLRRDERHLEQLLERLQDYLAKLPLEPAPGGRFRDYKGRLPLPAKGQILARYGAPKKIGKMRWKGLFLAGREGQNVISVARGRVAFADWLRGFGLLLILEHGDGYMTLYGHNQSLYTRVGDWVEAGQVIASMGSTGDAPAPGVYFEIREKGRPQDPLRWCRRP